MLLLQLPSQLMQFLETGGLTRVKNSNSFCWPHELTLCPAGDGDMPVPGMWWGWAMQGAGISSWDYGKRVSGLRHPLIQHPRAVPPWHGSFLGSSFSSRESYL